MYQFIAHLYSIWTDKKIRKALTFERKSQQYNMILYKGYFTSNPNPTHMYGTIDVIREDIHYVVTIAYRNYNKNKITIVFEFDMLSDAVTVVVNQNVSLANITISDTCIDGNYIVNVQNGFQDNGYFKIVI
jgi:hypothetical protein